MAATARDKLSPDQILAQGFEAHNIPDLISDEDDNEVTRVMDVDEGADSSRNPTMIPPRADDGDVYLLTKEHLRFKAGRVAPERVNLMDVMRAPSDVPPSRDSISDRETFDDVSERDTVTRVMRSGPPSLAPIAMDASVRPPARSRSATRGAAITAGVLAVAAIVAVLVPRAQPSSAAAATEPQAAAQAALEVEPAAAAPIELALVEIVAPVAPLESKVAELALVAITAAPPAIEQALPQAPAPEPKVNEEVPVPAPEPVVVTVAAELPAFDKSAANQALSAANRAASSCREQGVPTFPYNISVTFAPTGRVTNAVVLGAPYAGTPAGGCIARTFRNATIPAFGGSIVTVHKAFELP
jgi:hypothetical protein